MSRDRNGSPRRSSSNAKSRKSRSLQFEQMEARRLLANIDVTSLLDDNSGGTLREAIEEARDNSDPTDTILIKTGNVGGTIALLAGNGNLPDIPAGVTFDFSEPNLGPVVLDGGAIAADAVGLRFSGAGSTIDAQGLFSVVNFKGNGDDASVGILVAAPGIRVTGILIGLNSAGAALPNHDGVQITNAAGVTIGGTGAGERNVVSGNLRDGVRIGSGVSNLTFVNNYVGLNPAGATAVPNANGVVVLVSTGLVLGASGATSLNVISGNTNVGIDIQANQTKVVNSYIGLRADGAALAAPTGDGVFLEGSTGSTIGGAAGEGNVISGNALNGVKIAPRGATPASANSIAGNTIGLNPTADAARGNAEAGVLISDSGPNTITGNFLSSNKYGVEILTSTGNAANNSISANSIGFDTADADRGNTQSGIYVSTANATGTKIASNDIRFSGVNAIEIDASSSNSVSGNTITGATDKLVRVYNAAKSNTIGDGNSITGGAVAAVQIEDAGTSSNSIRGNTITGAVNGVVIGSGATGNTVGGGNLIAGNTNHGVWLDAPSNFVGGATPNTISGNTAAGVQVDKDLNTISGNWIGLNAAGDADSPNANGIVVNNVKSVSIGGATASAGNTISGNAGSGVLITGADTEGLVVVGNVIGLNAVGDGAVANSIGVRVESGITEPVKIGGAGTGNTITGNSNISVQILNPGTIVQGNTIGLDKNGAAIDTTDGVVVDDIADVQILDNVLSGNTAHVGLRIRGADSTGLVVTGNIIGLTSAAGAAAANSIGVIIEATAPNGVVIGGATPNTISGNTTFGIQVDNDGVKIQGNVIGLNSAGAARANSVGVWVNGVANVVVGGSTAADRNVISGNTAEGLLVEGQSATGLVVQGNFIGTNISGSAAVGNSIGIRLAAGIPANLTIGGDAAATPSLGNLISGNTSVGVAIETDQVKLVGNTVGLNAAGTAAVPNSIGVLVEGGQATIGGSGGAGDRNVISGNTAAGVSITGASALVVGNYVGLSTSGTAAVGNSIGIALSGVGATVGGADAGERNIISGNSGAGISVLSDGHLITGNFIGTNAAGTAAPTNLPATGDGVLVQADDVTIGGNTAALGNVISGNPGAGVHTAGANVVTLTMNANIIGLNAAGDAAVANSIGVLLVGDTGLSLDGADTPVNTISGNTIGVQLDSDGNEIVGYKIEGNGIGVLVNNAASNTIGGTGGAATRNTISGNTIAGVEIRGANSATTVLQGNWIGLDDAGTGTNPNAIGLLVSQSATIILDGSVATEINTISGNTVGVQFNSGGNKIVGYKIEGNETGILVNNTAGVNTIGGNGGAATRNTISGNTTAGIELRGSGSQTTVIQGNWIGLDDVGAAANPNSIGIQVSGATGFTLDGSVAAERNTISGNTVGVDLGGSGNTVIGTLFGRDAADAATIPNATGVLVTGASNTIGGTTPNTIFGGSVAGIRIAGAGATLNRIRANTLSGNVDGVKIEAAATLNTVGGTGAGDALNLSSSSNAAIEITGTGTNQNRVIGNTIGSNAGRGVLIAAGAAQNTIGGSTTAERNTIAGNSQSGVEIDGASNNSIQGNFIGTADGSTASANSLDGVRITGGATNNRVDGNVVSGNTLAGVRITGSGTTGNTLTSNSIGLNTVGAALANGQSGVLITSQAASNTVGAGNTISGNSRHGVEITAGATSNQVLGNVIGLGAGATAAVPNAFDGVHIEGAAGNTVGAAGNGNTISGNTESGVEIAGGAQNNLLQANIIGLTSAGAALGNTVGGVLIAGNGTTGNSIGSGAGVGNTISGNAGHGVRIDSGASSNAVLGNRIGTSTDGLTARPNTNDGVLVSDSGTSGNSIGGGAANTGNTIAGNTQNGVEIASAASGNRVFSNRIGLAADGTALPNGGDGVLITEAASNSVGAGNVISGNTGHGVQITGADSTGNTVSGSRIGLDPTGRLARPNVDGVRIAGGAASNLVGAGNEIAFNTGAGVEIDGSTGNTVSGSTIRDNPNGVVLATGATGNSIGGGNSILANTQFGVWAQASGNVIGGATPNTISGNGTAGVQLDAGGNRVAGNRIGLDGAGTAAVANLNGVVVNNAANSTIGVGNTISGNAQAGLLITGGGATGTLIEGAVIGLNVAGTAAVPNGVGVRIAASAPSGVVVGGAATNTISGNATVGVEINAAGVRIINNWFGLDAAGTGPVPNGTAAIAANGAANVSIGGTTAQRNIISGQSNGAGLAIDSTFGSGTRVVGNWFGLSGDGQSAVPNGVGVVIGATAPADLVFGGGAEPNVVSGNTQIGVRVDRAGFALSGNWIGLNGTGTSGVANSIGVLPNAANVTISGNTISGNSVGLEIPSAATNPTVVSNLFGFRADGSGSVGNTIGVQVDAAAGAATIGAVGSPNIVGNSSQFGVLINNNGTTLRGNRIGLDITGAASAANALGVLVAGTNASLVSNVISGNTTFGVQIDAAGASLSANTIGLDVNGGTAVPNNVGVWVNGAGSVTIGGAAADRNIVSGNTQEGVLVSGASGGLSVAGNRIGTNAAGTAAIPNNVGVRIDGSASPGATIGGTTPNQISGNTLVQVLIEAAGTTVAGNWIGLDASGNAALVPGSTADGVVLDGINFAPANAVIGGAFAATGNTIGGLTRGVYIHGSGASSALVRSSVIGLGADRDTVVPNVVNILVDSAAAATIGGASAGEGNTIGGATTFGVELLDADDALVRNNWIGVDGNLGNSARGQQIGVLIHGDSDFAVVRNNLIAANSDSGVKIDGAAVTSAFLAANTIGLNASGNALPNGNGVWITGGATGHTVGGTTPVDRNVISGNTGDGVLIDGASSAILVQGNYIGVGSNGTDDRGNGGDGVRILGSSGNRIGVINVPGSGNVISANGRYGVEISGAGATGNSLYFNLIGLDINQQVLQNGLGAIRVEDAIGNTIGDNNTISGGVQRAIILVGPSASNTLVTGVTIFGASTGILIADGANNNTIGPNNVFRDNDRYGVEISNASGNTIFGSTITGNSLGGVLLTNGATNNLIGSGNLIANNTNTQNPLDGHGVFITNGATGNTIGAKPGDPIGSGPRSTISGNTGDGVRIAAPDNTVSGALIGLDEDGTAAPNQYGVFIDDVSGIVVGGLDSATGNTISGNARDGVHVQGANATGVRIFGNIVGLRDDGTSVGNGESGVALSGGANLNTIGGSIPAERNVISGNVGAGVSISQGSDSNLIQGNYIGLDPTGQLARGNTGDGVEILDSGAISVLGNFIAANRGDGLSLTGLAATANTVSGNSIGVNVLGAAAGNAGDGIVLTNAGANVVGPGNLVANSDGNGVVFTGAGATGNHLFGSTIAGNDLDGVLVTAGAVGNTIDGLNEIRDNLRNGVRIDTNSNTVAGNSISGNSLAGVLIDNGSTGNRVTAGNTISGNVGAGVQIEGASSALVSGNLVSGNLDGVLVSGAAATANTVGGSNTITANTRDGVRVVAGANLNSIAGNSIGGNAGDGVSLLAAPNNSVAGSNTIAGNSGSGVEITGAAATGNTVGTNTISGNSFDGVLIQGGATGNLLTGTAIFGNQRDGVRIDAAGNTVGGAGVTGNTGDGVQILGPGNVLTGSTISSNTRNGVEVRGAAATGNTISTNLVSDNTLSGIAVVDASGNVLTNNTVSGNGQDGFRLERAAQNTLGLGNVAVGSTLGAGLHILGDGANGNLVVGSTFGRDGQGNRRGIYVEAGTGAAVVGTTIGSSTTGEGNTIAGNIGDGVRIEGAGVSGTRIFNNRIGVDGAGASVANGGHGLHLIQTDGNFVGGGAGFGNVISGNAQRGIAIEAGADGNIVQGNSIGVGADGNAIRRNGTGGVLIQDSASNWLTENLIGANLGHGVELARGSGNRLTTNTIGASALADLGNSGDGVAIIDSTGNLIGGDALELGNLISANLSGVRLVGGSSGNVIQRNLIGRSGDARSTAGNDTAGVVFDSRSNAANTSLTDNILTQNTLGGNNGDGVALIGSQTFDNVLSLNLTTDSTGHGLHLFGGARANLAASNTFIGSDGSGIALDSGASGNTFVDNVIEASSLHGVHLAGSDVTSNVFERNSIGVGLDGSTPAGNSVHGVVIDGGVGNKFERNVVAANGRTAVFLLGGASGNTLASNIVGLDKSGLPAAGLANNGWGVLIDNASNNSLTSNTVAANTDGGLAIVGPNASGNKLESNRFGLDSAGNGLAGGSPGVGVLLLGGANANTVGPNNVVSGFRGDGVRISGAGSDNNQLRGNIIGLSVDGTSGRANLMNGVRIEAGAKGNTVGGAAEAERNVISGNGWDGVFLDSAGNFLAGNRIGTTADGDSPAPNAFNGVLVMTGANTVGPGNTISGNILTGILLNGSGASGSSIFGNIIGLNSDGTRAVSSPARRYIDEFSGNEYLDPQYGIMISGASNVTVGGGPDAMRNVVAGNGDGAIYIRGDDLQPASGIQILGNYLGVAKDGVTGGLALRPSYNTDSGFGVVMVDAPNNTIGSNVLSGNVQVGLYVIGAGSFKNQIVGNTIGLGADGRTVSANHDGIIVRNSAQNTIVNNVISGNVSTGITVSGILRSDVANQSAIDDGSQADPLVSSDPVSDPNYPRSGPADSLGKNINPVAANIDPAAGANGNLIQSNLIGTTADGNSAAGNALGIFLNGAQFTQILSNVVSGNSALGIQLFNNATVFQPLNQINYAEQRIHSVINTTRNTISANLIGTSADGLRAVPNAQGLFINDAWGNVIGGDKRSDGNTISGNSGIGLQIMGDNIGKPRGKAGRPGAPVPTDNPANTVSNNVVGLGRNNTALPNDLGVFVNEARNPIQGNNIITSNRRGSVIIRQPNSGPTVDKVTTDGKVDTDPVTKVYVVYSQYVDPVKAATASNYRIFRTVKGGKPGIYRPVTNPKINFTVEFDVVSRTATIHISNPSPTLLNYGEVFKFIARPTITSRGTPPYRLDGTFNSKPGLEFSTNVQRGVELAPENPLRQPTKSKSAKANAVSLKVDMGTTAAPAGNQDAHAVVDAVLDHEDLIAKAARKRDKR